MKALIFGKTGQVATELAAQVPAGVSPIFLDRGAADLSDPAGCAQAVLDHAPDVVINAAAYTAVDRAEEEETLATTINGATPTEIAKAAASLGCPLLHVSTDYVFAGTGDAPMSVDSPTAPLGAYGRSKLAGEIGVQAAGGPHAILRTSWVFSAHGGNFVKTMLRLSETRDHLTVVGDQIGGPTAAADIASALWQMAQRFHAGTSTTGTYHFSGAPDVSWADFAREIFAQADRKVLVEDIPTSAYPTPAKRPGNSRMDCGTLARDFEIARPDWRISLSHVLKDLAEAQT